MFIPNESKVVYDNKESRVHTQNKNRFISRSNVDSNFVTNGQSFEVLFAYFHYASVQRWVD